jgi:predicted PhzF superfamily epimerase YddE/YHI9
MIQYVIDAFTDEVFKGNQAAVCFPKEWPSDDFMAKVAFENKFSETAFIIKEGGVFHIRWFTPGGEIDFCGHATLASACAIHEFVAPEDNPIRFTSMHGPIEVFVKDGVYDMHFPPYELKEVPVTDAMAEAAGRRPVEAWMGRDLLCLFDDEEFVRNMDPDQGKVNELDGLLFHATAKGKDFDCVSRTFAPKCNVPEDPVCGSGHCHIIPYWADKLGKKDIVAFQASERSGILYGKLTEEDLVISGKAAVFSKGTIVNEDGSWDC